LRRSKIYTLFPFFKKSLKIPRSIKGEVENEIGNMYKREIFKRLPIE
jgi:hypothetical protein